MKRKAIKRDALDVIALYHVTRGDGSPVITRQETSGMDPAEIKALFRSRVHVEHMVPHALTGDDHPSNLRFLTPDEHKPKTARDVTEIAKSKRVGKDTAAFRRRVLAKAGQGSPEAPEPPKKRKASMPSRGFQKAPEGHRWFGKGKR
tara:strand:+ start:4559 stop:4999 length:441 start_codon:yes stop_codon:yes gene_type:complete